MTPYHPHLDPHTLYHKPVVNPEVNSRVASCCSPHKSVLLTKFSSHRSQSVASSANQKPILQSQLLNSQPIFVLFLLYSPTNRASWITDNFYRVAFPNRLQITLFLNQSINIQPHFTINQSSGVNSWTTIPSSCCSTYPNYRPLIIRVGVPITW